MNMYDGRYSTATIGDVSGFSPQPESGGRAFISWQAEQNMIIKDYFYMFQSTGAVYAAGDNSIWFGWGFFNGSDPSGMEAVLGHEIMHALTGLNDPDLAKKLSVNMRPGSTTAISKWFKDNCISSMP
jgi:hypothetical protein